MWRARVNNKNNPTNPQNKMIAGNFNCAVSSHVFVFKCENCRSHLKKLVELSVISFDIFCFCMVSFKWNSYSLVKMSSSHEQNMTGEESAIQRRSMPLQDSRCPLAGWTDAIGHWCSDPIIHVETEQIVQSHNILLVLVGQWNKPKPELVKRNVLFMKKS